MNSMIEKVKSYVGFAIKSKQIKFGVDEIIKTKNIKLIMVSTDLSESSLSKINNYSKSKGLTIISLDSNIFAEVLQSTTIKAAAILNSDLAGAIKKNLTEK